MRLLKGDNSPTVTLVAWDFFFTATTRGSRRRRRRGAS